MKPLRVTFDSNAWQGIVCPDRFPNNEKLQFFTVLQRAITAGVIEPFLSETVVTLDAIPKRDRLIYLRDRPVPIQFKWSGVYSCEITIGHSDDAHQGLIPVLSDRIRQALELGFRVIPVPRLGGLPRPVEIQREEFSVALSELDKANVWALLQRISEAIEFIEGIGVGRAVLANIAGRIQRRVGSGEGDWFHGLDQPWDDQERKEIEAGFAEWADGDSVAAHIGYGIDVFCTEDQGKSAANSVFQPSCRSELGRRFGVEFSDLRALAQRIV